MKKEEKGGKLKIIKIESRKSSSKNEKNMYFAIFVIKKKKERSLAYLYISTSSFIH